MLNFMDYILNQIKSSTTCSLDFCFNLNNKYIKYDTTEHEMSQTTVKFAIICHHHILTKL